ncbi:hypothetical protein SNE40_010423 [Patella caerulea]|uniref:Uncharacterized protein n=1 Tax=Patella caerulea TaxID=87958 RepID=A0AAN8JUF4_PATCE
MKVLTVFGFICIAGSTLANSFTRCPHEEDGPSRAFHACNAPVLAAVTNEELCPAMTSAISCVQQLAIHCPSFMEAIGIQELRGLEGLARSYCKF